MLQWLGGMMVAVEAVILFLLIFLLILLSQFWSGPRS